MEKFALLNLLKAIETLSPPKAENAAAQTPAQPNNQPAQQSAPPEPATPAQQPAPPQTINVMANVLSRHEEISNRLRNKK